MASGEVDSIRMRGSAADANEGGKGSDQVLGVCANSA